MSCSYKNNKIVIDHKKLSINKPKISLINKKGNSLKDLTKPLFFWYQDTPIGKELFIALYTKKCEWARCSFCTLPSVSSPKYVSEPNILMQVQYILNALSEEQLKSIKRVFVSNNGSIFNTNTISSDTVDKISEYLIRNCSYLEYISFETRLDTIKKYKLIHYKELFTELCAKYYKKQIRKISKTVCLQISTGYETQDPFLRNSILCKGYPERMLLQFYKKCNAIFQKTGFRIYCDENVLLKPAAGITDQEAISECVQTILHLKRLGKLYNVGVSIRINPTFVAKGSALHQKFIEKKYTPPKLADVIEVLQKCKENDINLPIFIGLNEENLCVKNGSFFANNEPDKKNFQLLKMFNRDQNISLFEEELYYQLETY